jgi:(E)-4-hydroxy-3-methylbut-2-enyl-diphosphate synthase
MGALLAEGIGDTIRVSLTEDPENEIPVARKLADYFYAVAKLTTPKYLPDQQMDSFSFKQRKTKAVHHIGGNNVPVVIGADTIDENSVQMVQVTWVDLTNSFLSNINKSDKAVLVYRCSDANVPAELKGLRSRLEEQKCDVPVIFLLHLHERHAEDFQIKAAASLGAAFIDGFGNGIWLKNEFQSGSDILTSTSFGILQACRARIFKTEYIACPSCGRTHFNLMETLARIKAVTTHLAKLKIGVMGCIVNGPGEMADADYGYVGAGKGKITLYKGKNIIKTNIPENNAVDELVKLIKESGDWEEVKT